MRHRVQKWNVGPERRKERETFCGRFGKRTPFLRWRAQLYRTLSLTGPSSTTGCEEKRLANIHSVNVG